MKTYPRIALAAFLALGFVLPWAAAPARAAEADALPRIKPRMEAFVGKEIAGAVTLVAREGQVVHCQAVGLADRETGRPMTDDALFAIASMTKPIVATGAMILVDEGKLAIDDPVSKYIPEFKDAKTKEGPLARPITLRDCLTHTSGLGGSQQNQGTLEETGRMLAGRPLDFQPGARWQYSPGITVVGRCIEVAAGEPLDAFLLRRIFEPLGMTDTTFAPTPGQRARQAQVYQTDDAGQLAPGDSWLLHEPTPNPSGGLCSTAHDLARFYQMVLNGGELDGKRIVSRESVREMTRVQTGDLKTGFTDGNGWGLGWCIVRQPQGVTRMLSPGTFGHGGAFGTQGWVDPQKKTIYVMLIQRIGLPNGDASAMREAFQEAAIE